MPGPLFARDGDVSLRLCEEDDLEFVQANRNHPAVRGPLTDSTPRNRKQVEEYFENRISDDDTYHFLVCDESAGETDVGSGDADSADADSADADEDEQPDATPVGVVAIPWIREPHGVGSLMYWIAPEHHGNGYVTTGTRLILDYVFRERGLHKVSANVLESNDASRHVLEKLGFVEEGRQREECFVDGHREDFFRYGILASGWLDAEH